MTTIYPVEKSCANCGKRSEQVEMGSSNSFGSADLDTRPPEMLRSTIFYWVQRCPHCGYCAGDIAEKASDSMGEVISSPAYRHQIQDQSVPELAVSFLCWAMIQEKAGHYSRAGWSCIHAAWVCDDEQHPAALTCRRKAIDLLQQARQKGQMIATQPGTGEAVLVDLLRRSGQFDLALSLCEDGIRQFRDGVIGSLLRFQRLLIKNRDTGCYTVAQAQGNA